MLLIEGATRQAAGVVMQTVAVHFGALGATPEQTSAAIAIAVGAVLANGRSRAKEMAQAVWLRQTGAAISAPPIDAAAEAEIANRRARALAAQWSRANAEIERARADVVAGGGPYRSAGAASEYVDAAAESEWAIDRTATTETAEAWNSAQYELSTAAERAGYALVYTWEAEGGKRTCPRCSDLNGQETTSRDGFDQGWPPLHANCRCQITTSMEPVH